MLICSLPMKSRQIDNWLLTPSQAMLICSLPMTSKKTDLQITDFNTQSARMVTAWWWRAEKGWLLLHLLLLLHRLALFHKITDARCWEQNGSTHDPVVMTFKHQFLTNSARNGVKHTQNSTHVFFFYSIPIKRASHASSVQIPFNAKNTSGQIKATLLYVTRNMDHLQQHKTSCRNNVIKQAMADSRLCLQEICTTCNNTRHLQNNSILNMVYHKETSTSSSTWEKVWEALLVATKNSHQNV